MSFKVIHVFSKINIKIKERDKRFFKLLNFNFVTGNAIKDSGKTKDIEKNLNKPLRKDKKIKLRKLNHTIYIQFMSFINQ